MKDSSRGQSPELTPRHQLPQAVDGKRDVEIAHDRRAIEADAGVALHDVRRPRIRGDHAVALVAGIEWPVTAPV